VTEREVDDLGLEPGAIVRFRRRSDQRWKEARVVGVERDGSVRLRDGNGASRSIAVDRIEVPVTGPKGHVGWKPLAVHATDPRQLDLF
jgi:hypothetical protein